MSAGDSDEGARRPVPDPLDRLWVHPSELFARHRGPRPRRPGRSRRASWGLPIAAAGAGALLTLGVLAAAGWLGHPSTPAAASDAELVARITARAAPSVVTVAGATKRASGVCVGPELVLTSTDATAGADTLRVTSVDGHAHPATIIGRDTRSGLALLRVGGTPLKPAVMPARAGTRVGDAVVAVGAGDRARHWVTTGTVSSLVAKVESSDSVTRTGLIATDAVVADDAAGGALFDRHGQLVGILTAPAPGDAVGLAIPASVVRDVARRLRTRRTAARGWMGVEGSDSASPVRGVVVDNVTAGGPAARAGVAPGDVITKLDGAAVPDMETLTVKVRLHRPGDRLELVVTRDGAARTATVELGTYVEDSQRAPSSTTVTAATVTTAAVALTG